MKLKEKLAEDFANTLLLPYRAKAKEAWLRGFLAAKAMALHEAHEAEGVVYQDNTARNTFIDSLADLGEEKPLVLAEDPQTLFLRPIRRG